MAYVNSKEPQDSFHRIKFFLFQLTDLILWSMVLGHILTNEAGPVLKELVRTFNLIP